MSIEQNEAIIDSQATNENDETIVVEEVSENDTEDTNDNEPVQPPKTEETPEAKHARLKRQLAQHEKKYGLKIDAPKKAEVSNKETNVSVSDYLALTRNNVHEDDVSDVEEFAQFKKISIAEALKSSTLQSILKEKQEFRATSQATSTGKSRKSPAKVSDENLVTKAISGELPENDDDMIRLVKARRGIKK